MIKVYKEKGRGVPIIVMLFPGQYDKAPRLQRECYILSKAGYHIHIIDIEERGVKFHPSDHKLENVTYHHIALPSFSYEKTGNVIKRTLKIIERLIHYLSFYILASFLLLRLSDRYKIMCIHCNHLHTMPVGIIFKKILRCKLVYDAYEFYYFYFEKRAPKFLVPALQKVEEKLAPHADLTIVCWRNQKLFLQSRYNIQNVVIFPNLPIPDYFKNDDSRFKRESTLNRMQFCIRPSDFIVLYCGSFKEKCKLKDLFEACSFLVNKYKLSFVKIMMVGDGPLFDELKGRAEQLKIKQNVIFLGRLPYEKVVQCYMFSDVVYAMYETEGQYVLHPSQKIFEAMLCKKPVITCHLGENKKLVTKARCGFAIKPEPKEISKAILKLIKNKHLRMKMSVNGYQYYVKNFSWDKYREKLLSAYNELTCMQ